MNSDLIEPISGTEKAIERAEFSIIASLLCATGEHVPDRISRLLDFAPNSFQNPFCGDIAKAINLARTNGKVPDLIEILPKLNGKPVLLAQELANGTLALPLDLANLEAEPALARFHSQKLISTLGDAWQEARQHPDQAKPIAQVAIAAITNALADLPATDLPPILDSATFAAQDLPKSPQIVQGLLHQGAKMVIAGGSKSFKTWVQLDLALCIAYGITWLGFPTTQGKVLFVNFEIQPEFFQERLNLIAKAHGLKLEPNRLDVWNLRGKSAPYHIIIPKIFDRIKDILYSTLILDPAYKLYGKTDENSASDVAQLLNAFESLCVDTGSAVAFGAHYSKGNQAAKESIDRVSGSGVFSRDPDSIINFTKHEENDAFTVEPILRNLPPVEPFVVRWRFPLMVRDEYLDPAKLKKSAGRPKSYSDDDVWQLIESPLTTTEWETLAKSELGISRSMFFNIRKSLQSQNRIILSKINGKWTQIIPKQNP